MDEKRQDEICNALFPAKELAENFQRVGDLISKLLEPGTISKPEIKSVSAEIQKELNNIFVLGASFGRKELMVELGWISIEQAKAMGTGGQR